MRQDGGGRGGLKRFSRNDGIFIVVLAVAAAVGLLVSGWGRKAPGAKVIVTVDGEVYGEYSLDKDREVPIQIDGVTTNLLVIRDQAADMTEAGCPDRLCVQQKAVSRENETIVCLPNRVVVQVTGGKESGLDTIAK